MRTSRLAWVLPAMMFLGTTSLATGALAPEKAPDDKTLSPYFLVLSESKDVDQLPLKSTRADVTVSGVIAQVKVTQVYKNEGKHTLEAVYVFPGSTRAAVYAMRMTIGERVLEAKIKERQQARQEYEQALQQGKTASLLEQQRPNVFQMNVGNILPGDVIKVEMQYTELLVPENGIYEFVYPTVVGPRYSNKPAAGAADNDKWVENPYLHSGKDAPFTFGLDLTLNAGLPIAQVTSPSHEVKVEYTGKTAAHLALPESTTAGNRDFVLKYALAGEAIESGLLLYPGQDENFFLLMLEPPKRVAPKAIVPREYIFIVDCSGSMEGYPLNTTKALMKNLFSRLRPSDYFNVLLFAGDNAALSEKSLAASPANVQKALDVIDHQGGGGGTELLPALKRALALPRAEGTSRTVVIATDGYVDVEKEAFEVVRTNLGRANLFAFGIGSSVNRFLIEGLARAGMGEPFVVLDPDRAEAEAAKLAEYIASPVLTGIQVKFPGFNVYDVEPESVPDLFARRPLIVFGKYKGAAAGAVRVTGETAAGKYEVTLPAASGLSSPANGALRYLWARHRILRVADMNQLDPQDARVKEVTDLGLRYNLMTEYTSFVAVDTVVRADGQKIVKVKQPLPLPQGVSDHAVGGAAQGVMSRSVVAAPAAPMLMAEKRKMAADEAEVEPPKPVGPSVEAGIDAVTGDLDFDAAADVLVKGRAKLLAAYQKELKRAPGLKGSLLLELTVGPDGRVTGVKVAEDKLSDQALLTALTRVLQGLVFAKPKDGKPAGVTVRLDLSA